VGLELTVTPQVEQSGDAKPFGNVIYGYPRSRAMDDGFVKEPVAATRVNFKRDSYTDEELERLKLEDGISGTCTHESGLGSLWHGTGPGSTSDPARRH